MAGFTFEVTYRGQTTIANVIHAEMKDLRWKMTLYLDIDTGNILYPVKIEKLMPDMRIVFDSEDMVSCSLSPSIPESKIDAVIEHLVSVHDVITAARKLIKEEQIKLKNENASNDDEEDIEDTGKVPDGWLAKTDKIIAHDALMESWEMEDREMEEWDMESWDTKAWDMGYWKIAADMKKCVEIIRRGRSMTEKKTAADKLKRHLERCLDDVNLSDLTVIYKGKRKNNAIGFDPPAVAQFVGRMVNRYPKPKVI